MAMKQWFGDINKFVLIGDYFVDGRLLALESEAENYCSLSLYLLVTNVMPRIYSMNSKGFKFTCLKFIEKEELEVDLLLRI